MDLLLEYKVRGIDGLKRQMTAAPPKGNAEKVDVAKELVALSKESQIKQDIDAQKVILNQLFQLEAYEEARKLCRKILIRKPNDAETQDLQMQIRQRLNSTGALEETDSSISLLERNKRIFEKIEKSVHNKIIGQWDLIQHISKLVQKSLLNSNPIHHYKEAMFISSPKSQGVHTTIRTFFKYVYQSK